MRLFVAKQCACEQHASRDVDELLAIRSRRASHLLVGLFFIDAKMFHEHAFGALNRLAIVEISACIVELLSKLVKFVVPLERDDDCGVQLLRSRWLEKATEHVQV